MQASPINHTLIVGISSSAGAVVDPERFVITGAPQQLVGSSSRRESLPNEEKTILRPGGVEERFFGMSE